MNVPDNKLQASESNNPPQKKRGRAVAQWIGFGFGMVAAMVAAYPLLDRVWLYGLSGLGRPEMRGTVRVGMFSTAVMLIYGLVGVGRLRGWGWAATPWKVLSVLGLVVGLVVLALWILISLVAPLPFIGVMNEPLKFGVEGAELEQGLG